MKGYVEVVMWKWLCGSGYVEVVMWKWLCGSKLEIIFSLLPHIKNNNKILK